MYGLYNEITLKLNHVINHSTCPAKCLTTGQDFTWGLKQEMGARNSTFQCCNNPNRLSISTFLNCFKTKHGGLGSTQFFTSCFFWSLIRFDLNSKWIHTAKPNRFLFNISQFHYSYST